MTPADALIRRLLQSNYTESEPRGAYEVFRKFRAESPRMFFRGATEVRRGLCLRTSVVLDPLVAIQHLKAKLGGV